MRHGDGSLFILKESGPRYENDGGEDRNESANTKEGRDPGMTVHQILQTFQFGVYLETCFSHLEMFCLDLHIDVLCRGSWVSLEVGEVVDVEVLLL